jgi:hypothetical protein
LVVEVTAGCNHHHLLAPVVLAVAVAVAALLF